MFSFPVQNFCVLISPELALICLFGQFSCWVPKPVLSFKDTWPFIAPLSHLPTASRLRLILLKTAGFPDQGLPAPISPVKYKVCIWKCGIIFISLI